MAEQEQSELDTPSEWTELAKAAADATVAEDDPGYTKERWFIARDAVLFAAVTFSAQKAALEAEMQRRDQNEDRNCINWGPCSRNDGRMSEGNCP